MANGDTGASTAARRARLRSIAEHGIGPVDGGYLRPWMCAGDPATARVFLVGANPATPFPVESIGRTAYLDALTTQNDRLHELYLRLRGGSPSPTRLNIERVVRILSRAGAGTVLETNVWTLPTPSLAALRRAGTAAVSSSTVLDALIEVLAPLALIVHGSKATQEMGRLLERPLKTATRSQPVIWHEGHPVIMSLPSLSPPPANGWLPSSGPALEVLAARLAAVGGTRA